MRRTIREIENKAIVASNHVSIKKESYKKIKKKIDTSASNFIYRLYYSLRKNKERLAKYEEYVKDFEYANEIVNNYIAYVGLVESYYGYDFTWRAGNYNADILVAETKKISTFENYCLGFDRDGLFNTYKTFVKLCNEAVKDALEDPSSHYNQRKTKTNNKVNNNNIPRDVVKALIKLGLKGGNVNATIIKKAYKEMAIKNHPDKGGSTDKMAEINIAYDTAMKYFNRNKKGA